MQLRLRIVLIVFVTAALFLLLSSLADGAWHETQITMTSIESTAPRIVHDRSDALHVFWEEGGEIRHQILGVQGVEILGEGRGLDLSACPVCGVLSIAWIGSDDRPHFRSWVDGVWSDASDIPMLFGPAYGIAVSHHGDGRLLWAEYDSESQEVVVLFATQSDGAWSRPLEIGRTEPYIYAPQSVAIGLRRTGADGRLLASWVGSELSDPMGLMVRSGQGPDWDPANLVYDWLAGQYSVDTTYPSGISHFAGNGPQPACPCNVLIYISGTEGSWSEPEQIGGNHYPAEMEWPQEMSVHVRNLDDVPFVVWRHESYGEMLQRVDERLILGRKEAGAWSFDYDLAIGRNAHRPDVSTSASGDAYVVWSDDSDGFMNLYLATTEPVVDAPAPVPVVGGDLSVYPNPSRNGSFIEWTRAGFGESVLRVFDAGGREVMSSRLAARSGAGRDRVWWKLTDRAGEPLPAGVYQIELRSDAQREESRLVIVR